MLKTLISKYLLILKSQYFSLLLLGWIYYFINLKLWAWAVTEWESGYFIYFDSWIPWMDSCLECDNSTEWTTWSDNMYLDSSNQCIFCSDGEYYDSTAKICRPCNNSWINKCAYQLKWFSWDSGQFFDLKKMMWVSSWDTNSIAITDDQLWGFSVWRSFNYYVNPKSQEIIELGTKAYPYKNIGLPFVEILNYHSHSNNSINIYVMENTDNYMLWNSNYIINITSVSVQSYSLMSTSTQKYANIYIKNKDVSMFANKTIFWILKDNTLRLHDKINYELVMDEEISNSKC